MIIKNVKNQSVGLFCLFWFFKFYLFIYFVKNGTLRTPNMEAVLQFSSFPHCHFLHVSQAMPLPSFLWPPPPGDPAISTRGFGILICVLLNSQGTCISCNGLSHTLSSEVLDHCPSLYFSSVKWLGLWTLLFTWVVSSQKKNFLSITCSSILSSFISVFFSHPKTLHICFYLGQILWCLTLNSHSPLHLLPTCFA